MSGTPKDQGTDARGRPYIGIMFDCCNVYQRIYRNKAGTAYVGYCPRCMRRIQLKISEGGTGQRMFRAQ